MNVHRRLLLAGGSGAAALGAAIAIGLAGAALAVVGAWLLADTLAGAILDGKGIADLAPGLVALGLVLAARAGLAWASEVAAVRISGRVKAQLRGAIVRAALAQGARVPGEGSTARTALLATRGLDALDGYYARYVPTVALAAIVPVVVAACLAAVDLLAALTVALTVPLIPLFMALIGRMSAAHRERRWAMLGRLAHRFADVVAGLPTLRVFGRAEAQVGILRLATDAYRVSTLATLRIAFLSALVLELLATLSVALVAVGVGLRLQAGGLGLQVGLFALVLAPEAYLPLRRMGAEFHAAEEGLAAARDAFALLDAPAAAEIVPGLPPPARLVGLSVEGVSVEQPGRGVEAPDGATLEVRAGELLAVTGVSGAGKSTLLAVVLGLTPPTRGRVLALGDDVASVDVAAIDGTAWRGRIAWVPQVPYLAPGTVAANVRLGAPGAPDDAVRAALTAVGLGDLPLDRAVGEGGAGLSSGQRRRLGIARALLRRAPLLLLDEPTAGLDAAAEAQAIAAIRAEADRGAAVVLVAHRPGAVAGADRTVELRWAALEREDEGAPCDGGARRDATPAATGAA